MLYYALIDTCLALLIVGMINLAGNGNGLTITPRTTSSTLPKPGTSWHELWQAMQKDYAEKEQHAQPS